jgi:hypothetical protein
MYRNPFLIALLRRSVPAPSSAPVTHDDPSNHAADVRSVPELVDDLAPARGVGLSVLLGVLLWAAIVTVLWLAVAGRIG